MKICYIILYLFLSISCTNTNKTTDISTINITINDKFQPIIADSIFSSVDYIPLETSDSSLITNIHKICMDDSLIYILDNEQEIILAFNKKGEYIHKLNKKGRGNGEYLSLDDFFITDSLIYVLSSAIQKILIYDLKFNFVSDFKIETYATNISHIDETLYVFTNFSSQNLKHFHTFNINTRKCLHKTHPFLEKQRGTAYEQSTFTTWNKEMYYFIPYDYSIYKFNNDKVEKVFNLNFGEKNMYSPDFKDYSDEERKGYQSRFSDHMNFPIDGIDDLYISDNLLFFSFIKGIFPYNFFQFKKSNSEKIGSIRNSKTFPLANNQMIFINDKYYVCISKPEDVSDLKERGFSFPINLMNLEIDDNPILCFLKFNQQ